MAQIPAIKKPRFYDKKWIVECVAIIPPIILAAVTAWANFLDPAKLELGWVLITGIAWLIIASILKVLHAYQQDKEYKSKQNLAIHRVVPSAKPDSQSEELEQLLPYIGGEGGGAGRRFSIRSGIIGRAAREKAPFLVQVAIASFCTG